MDYSPHITDINKWKNHFMDMASSSHGKTRKIYTVGKQSGGSGPSVQLVTPTEQAVQMAKADLKRKHSPIKRRKPKQRKQSVKKPGSKKVTYKRKR